ncbi:ABC transporter permease [Fulvivirgaceae bacterium BMA12]|uniref:ABC transporter permease n=1 Tax=Agaribacillus aureus TaxID=3051825 RepID=A0ABT8LE12_9BACT|nr:ABC transporter permease [Fulvivirgaceae bacterium BMA12]
MPFQHQKLFWRLIRKQPVYTLTIIFTLALGIGASAAIFSFVNALLLKPLPYHDPERLVVIKSLKGNEEGKISIREARDLLEWTTAFEDIATYRSGSAYNISADEENSNLIPEEVPATLCSGNLFAILGLDMHLGKAWPEDYDLRRTDDVVLTHELWQRRYGGDPDILQNTITLDGSPSYTVFGILPPGINFPFGVGLFRSGVIFNKQVTDRKHKFDYGLGRLRADISFSEAKRQVEAAGKKLADNFPETNDGLDLKITTLQDLYMGNIRPYLYMLSIAVIFLLLIACVNVANLQLSAAAGRDREVAVRTILGSGKRRLISQFITESITISLLGGVLGVLLSFVIVDFFRYYVTQELPHWIEVTMDLRVLLFAFLLSITCGVLTGITPALKSSSINLSNLIKASKGSTGSRQRNKLRKVFVAAELALGVLLLVGSGMIFKSFDNLQKENIGLDLSDIFTFKIALPWKTYPRSDPQKIGSFYHQTMANLEKIPGVEAVVMNSNLPLSVEQENAGYQSKSKFTVEAQTVVEQRNNPFVNYQFVTTDYFEMMGIPLVHGRTFNEFDLEGASLVAVISQGLAEKMWPDQDPLGLKVKWGDPDHEADYYTIVGVVDNIQYDFIGQKNSLDIYISSIQEPQPNQYLLLKTKHGMDLVPEIKKAVLAADANQSTYDHITYQELIDVKLWQNRLSNDIFAAFALLALLLSGIGIYSVMAYAVGQRTKELGVRRVLGAERRDMFKMIVFEVLKLALAGLSTGLLLSIALSNYFSSTLYSVETFDFQIFGMAAVFLFLVTLLAAVIPAQRATSVNPVMALRAD